MDGPTLTIKSLGNHANAGILVPDMDFSRENPARARLGESGLNTRTRCANGLA
jgi:hypothetical protein